MSIATLNEFVNTIDPKSEGFIELARSTTSAPDLAVYAQKHGIELTTEEAAEAIDGAKQKLEAAGIGPLSEDALENVSGGVSMQAIFGVVGAGAGLLVAAVAIGPLVGAIGVGAGVASMAFGTATVLSAISGIAGAGLGMMGGAIADIIEENNK